MRKEQHIVFWFLALCAGVALLVALRGMLLPFVAGLVLAYLLNPLADALQRLGLGRLLATILLMIAVTAAFVAAVVLLVPMLVAQGQQFAASIPSDLDKARAVLEGELRNHLGDRFPFIEAQLRQGLAWASENWSALASYAARSVLDRGLALVHFLSLLVVTPLVLFYLLLEWHTMLATVESWVPRQNIATVRRLGRDIDAAVAAFLRGQGLVCILLAIFYAVGLGLIGLRYGLFVGLATGALAFVPFVGWIAGTVAAVIIAVAQFWPTLTPIGLVAAVMLAGYILDSAVLSSYLVGSRLGLHPLWHLFALFAFSCLLGVVGMIIAVPVTAAIGVLVRHFMSVYLESSVFHGQDGAPAPLSRQSPAAQ